jgi:RNA polymerase sigma factor (sigma-70 family)
MNDSHVELAELVDRLRAGDENAGGKLFERVYSRHVQLARLMLCAFPGVSRRHEPESLVHQGWIDLDTALRSVTPETPKEYLGLLAVKMRFTLLDIAKKEKGKGATVSLNRGDWNSTDSTTTFDPAAGSTPDPGRLEVWTRFHEAVSELPDNLREAFELYFYTDEKPNQAEVAKVLGVSPRKVSRLIAKAKDQLVERVSGLSELLT